MILLITVIIVMGNKLRLDVLTTADVVLAFECHVIPELFIVLGNAYPYLESLPVGVVRARLSWGVISIDGRGAGLLPNP